MRYSHVLIKPVITEKSMKAAEDGYYTFKVNMKAKKGTIADELRKMFDVEAVEIRSAVVPGKPKRILGTRRYTKTKKWKKAVIKLKEGQKLDIFPKE